MTSAHPLLSLQNVSRHFTLTRGIIGSATHTVRAVNDVSLMLNSAETLGLVGESGCGKSTLARMVVGLMPPSEGDILLHGRSLVHGNRPSRAELASQIQMIFQDPFASLNPRMRIGESIAEPLLSTTKSSAKERAERVAEMLDLVGLQASYAARYPHEFSGGQRQRIAIARALIAQPQLVVCDEAVSSLDASVQAQVLNLLRELQERFGLAYLFISHDLSVVGHMSTHVAVMYLGTIVEKAPRNALFKYAAHPYTQALLAAVPHRNPDQRTAHVPLSGDLPSPIAIPTGCPFHPRCPQAMPLCQQKAPAWHTIANEHSVRCHLYN